MFGRRQFLGWTAAAAAGLGAFSFPKALALQDGQPSRTALGAARYRAAHQLLEEPRVLDDPLALRILGESDAAWLRGNLDRQQAAYERAMRAFIAMRSRYAEDRLAEAVARGVRQYVILGAGLDTFACRNPHSGLRVFEVDFPATQVWKRERLAQTGIAIPGSLTFAPVDFERQTLAEGLRAAGLRSGEPALFSMLGVVIYLTRDAVMDTMRFAASHPAGSEIVFDFSPPPSTFSDTSRMAHASAAARVAAIGEPWISYFDPAALADDLRATGFGRTRILAAAEANEQYFKDRADGFRLYGSGRMMAARV